ncbi:hypothetical protein ACGFIR_30410 [Micromonospora sp. NPDC049051]|uniref:hypothetical protein n=1 Tax=Micromonospora sp. NPDC049051 TaxID=3364264 RepID=UPI0037222FA7
MTLPDPLDLVDQVRGGPVMPAVIAQPVRGQHQVLVATDGVDERKRVLDLQARFAVAT